jgi:putative chitinase
MCIAKSVGRNAVNQHDDVKTVQILLNLNMYRLPNLQPLTVDGGAGKNTIAAIEEFQFRVLETAKPDGKVDPGGKTLAALRAGMPDGFSEEKLQGIMIHASKANIGRFYIPLKNKMTENLIDTPRRMEHFLAQIAHESGEFRYTEEIASGEAYEGRADLGNTEAGDGKRFKGRGLIQLTGRDNYKKYGDARGKDYTTDTSAKLLSTDPGTAVDVSAWYWAEKSLNSLADGDDVMGVTHKINGGYNGLADRKKKLQRAKFFLEK